MRGAQGVERTRALAASGAAVAAARALYRKAQDASLLRRSRANLAREAEARARYEAAREAAAASLNNQAHRDALEHLSTGGTFEVFSDRDAETVARFREHFGPSPETTCGHSLIDTVAPLRWTPRASDRLLCAQCEATTPPLSVSDTCDVCGTGPAIGFREVPVPAGTHGDVDPPALTPPIRLFLRLCESCE